jgi:hypothetical protein
VPQPPARAPDANATIVDEKPAAKSNGKPNQRTALKDKESVTLVAKVLKFKTRVINKAPSVEAEIECPEFKGTVYHIGCAKVEGTGESAKMTAPPEWQTTNPIKIAMHGKDAKQMGVVAIVDLVTVEDDIQF